MLTENLQAFVLSTLDYGDSDRIVSLFSLEHGRIKGFARGARNSRKRFGAALESFARIEAQIRVKDGLSGLKQAEIINIYPEIVGPDRIEFDSMINIRPARGNRTRSVDDPAVREKIFSIVEALLVP